MIVATLAQVKSCVFLARGRLSTRVQGECGGDVCCADRAEWEREARNIDGREYPWGDAKEDLAQRGNMAQAGIGSTSAVGLFPRGEAVCRAADLAGTVRT